MVVPASGVKYNEFSMRVNAGHSLASSNINSIEQAEFYKVLVNSIQDYAIFLLDPLGKVASWNIGAKKLKGYEPDEIIGQHFSIFYSEADREANKPEINLRESRRDGHVEDEGWRYKKDGTKFWADVVITPLYGSEGVLIGYAKVTRDLTERKLHKDQLEEANRILQRQHIELEALNNAKDEFVSLASHQLRTPATGVKQFLGIVMDGYAGDLTDQQRDYLHRAYDSNERQIELVNSLLKVAQVDAGKVSLVRSMVDVVELARDVISEQEDSFRRRSQKLHVSLPDDSIVVSVDKLRFRMVLENLIDNASKYTPESGEISVSVDQSETEILISVRDTGVGINADELSKLFVKFSRIPNALSDVVGGSGLGLYWASKIVSLHGGSISVDSTPGNGSEFRVVLPKVSEGDELDD